MRKICSPELCVTVQKLYCNSVENKDLRKGINDFLNVSLHFQNFLLLRASTFFYHYGLLKLHWMACTQSILRTISTWQVHKDGMASTQRWDDASSEEHILLKSTYYIARLQENDLK